MKRRLAALPLILLLTYMLFGLLPTMMLWGGGEKPATWVIALSPFFISGFIAILLGAVGLFIYAVED